MARKNLGSQQQANYYFDRGNPEPLDSSMLYNSYSDLKLEIDKGKKSIAFAGMYTAIESNNVNNTTYNGPYYIKSDKNPERIVLKSEADKKYKDILTYFGKTNDMLYWVLEQPKYTKPNITVQFLSAANKQELTSISDFEEICEDVEIGTRFQAGIQINWPQRTSTNENGTRSSYAYGQCDTNTPNELLGYSYGIAANGISFNTKNITAYTTNILDTTIKFVYYTVNSQNSITLFSDINISYLPASYMYYPQLYKHNRYEISYGENDTAFFGEGVCKPKTQKYIVTGKYRYYWGFSNTLPGNKSDLQKGNSGLLNNTTFSNGTTTSCIVGDGYDKTYFWVAFPSTYYDIVEYDEEFKILLEQADGSMFDLIGDNKKMSSTEFSVILGDILEDSPSAEKFTEKYKITYLKFEHPIGNKSSVVSFRILPIQVSNLIYTINDDNNNMFCLEDESTLNLTTDTDNDTIC